MINNDNNNHKKILIVDDEPDITTVFSMALKECGFEVYSFNNPIMALSNFKLGFYDLVILDIKMANMSGFELYAEMKKIDSQIKVCFITAAAAEMYYDDEFRKQEAREGERQEQQQELKQQLYCRLNKDMFLQKPISNEDLVKEINKRITSILKVK
jgi:CheY-like chemotaxis protein